MAIHAISATLGMFFKPTNDKIGRPNVMLIMASPPGITRRSTVLRYHNALVDTALMEYYKRINKISPEDAWKLVNLSKIESGTEAGICDAIIENINGIDVSDGRKIKIDSFRFSSPEYGDTFRKMSTEKDPTAGVDKLLCRLWDGEGYTQRLSQRGRRRDEEEHSRFIPDNLYFTMFSSMQEPQQYLKGNRRIVTSGLMRRLKIGYVKSQDLDNRHFDLFPPGRIQLIDAKGQLRTLAKKDLVERMVMYHDYLESKRRLYSSVKSEPGNNVFLDVHFHPDVETKLNKLNQEVEDKVKISKSDYSICKQSDAQHIGKFAMNLAIGEDNWIKARDINSIHYPGSMMVEMRHYDKAIQILNIIDKNFEETISGIAITEKMEEQELLSDKVERIIRKGGPKGKSHSDLLHALPGLKTDELKEQIETLMKKGVIFLGDYTGDGKKRALVYVHKDFEEKFQE